MPEKKAFLVLLLGHLLAANASEDCLTGAFANSCMHSFIHYTPTSLTYYNETADSEADLTENNIDDLLQ